MHHKDGILTVRRKPVSDGNQIPLEEWLAYIAASSIVKAKPPTERRGINPFTKQPVEFHSPPGGAVFQGPRGQCEVEYHAGALVVHGAAGHAEDLVAQIATALNAEVQL